MAGRVIGTATVEVKADTSGFSSALSGLTSSLGSFRSKIQGLVAGIGFAALAKKAISFGEDYRKALDQSAASITGLMGVQHESASGFDAVRAYASGASDSLSGLSVEETNAATLLRQMTEYAIKTPFDLPGVEKATTMLLAYGKSFGVTKDNVLGYVDVIGNAAAANGKGAEAMNNVITVLGKISGQGKITTRDFNTLTANFPSLHPWDLLSEKTGKSVEELRKLALKPGGLNGIVDTTDFIHALVGEMAALPGAAGAMDRQMQTLSGTMAFFKDSMGVALANGLAPFFGALQKIMMSDAVNAALTNLIGTFSLLATTLIQGLAPYLPMLITSFDWLLAALVPLMPVVGQLAQLFAIGLIAITPFIDTLVQLTTAAMNFIMALDPNILKAIGAALVLFASPFSAVSLAIAGLAILIADNWDWIKQETQKIVDWFQGVFQGPMGDAIIAFAGTIVVLVGALQLWKAVQGGINALMAVFDAVMDANPIGLVVVAIAALVAGLVLAYQHIDWFRKAVDGLVQWFVKEWPAVKAAIADVVNWMVNTAWPAIQAATAGVVDWLANVAWPEIQRIFAGIVVVVTNVVNFVVANWPKVQAAVAAVVDWLVNSAWPALQAVWDGILTGVRAVVDFIVYAWPGVSAVIGAVVDWLVNTAWPALQAVWDGILAGVRAVVDFIVYAWPGVQTAVGAVVDFLVAAWPKVVTVFTVVADVIGTVVGAIVTAVSWVADRIGDVVGVIQDHWSQISKAASDTWTIISQVVKFAALLIGAAITVIVEVVKVLMAIWQVTGPIIMAAVQAMVDVIVQGAQMVWAVWSAVWPNIVAILSTAWNVILAVLGAAISVITGIIGFFADLLTGQWGQLWGDVLQVLQGIWDAIVAVVTGAIGIVVSIVEGLVNAIVGFFTWLWDTLVGNSIIPDMVDAIIAVFTYLWDTLVAIVQAIMDGIVAIWNAIAAAVTAVVDGISSFLSGAWNLIKSAASTAWNLVKDYIINPLQEAWNWVVGVFSGIVSGIQGIWNDITSAASTAWDLIKSYVINPLQEAWDWVTGTFNAIVGDLQGIWDTILGAVTTAWNSIQSAITAPFQAAWNTVQQVAGWIQNAVTTVTNAVASLNPFASDPKLAGAYNAGPATPHNARGSVIDRPMVTWVGEGYRRETIIPNTDPGRALQLMQMTGLDRLVRANQGASGTNFNGPLISMPGAVIQDATDAQVVAQQTVAAMSALMVS